MRRLLATAFLTLPLACSGSSDPAALISAADTAMGSGDHATALAKYSAALAELDSSSPQYARAKLGTIEAMAFEQPDRCVDELLALAAGGEANERDFAQVGGMLASGAHFGPATKLLQGGTSQFAGSTALQALLERVRAQAEQAKHTDPDAAKALEGLAGLGYFNSNAAPASAPKPKLKDDADPTPETP